MSVSMTMNGAVLPILAMYIVAAEEQVLFVLFVWMDGLIIITRSPTIPPPPPPSQTPNRIVAHPCREPNKRNYRARFRTIF